ncbi:MAG: PDGLE domain-containing protein [Candidatus Nanopelagicaceae bacterium]
MAGSKARLGDQVINQKKFFLIGAVVTLILAGVVSFYASSSPDGLEKVAERIGFIDTAKDHAIDNSPLADYGVEGIENDRVSVGISGIIGVAITGVVAYIIFMALARKKRDK